MKLAIAAVAVLVLAWAGLWVSDTGLLVYSAETRVPKVRDCRYFIGVTVLRRLVPLADRCPVLRENVGR
jgi:hypothetical protein